MKFTSSSNSLFDFSSDEKGSPATSPDGKTLLRKAADMPGKDSSGTIDIVIPPDYEIKNNAESFCRTNTKDQILTKFKRYADNLRNAIVRPVGSDGNPAPVNTYSRIVLEGIGAGATKKLYQFNKTDLSTLLAIVTDPHNRMTVKRSQPEQVVRLEEYIALHGIADVATVRKICGANSIVEHKKKWWSDTMGYDLSVNLLDFRIWRDYERLDPYGRRSGYSKGFYLTNPTEYAVDIALEVYSRRLRPFASLTPDQLDQGTIIETMPIAGMRYDMIKALIDSGIITPGSNKLLTKSQLKRIDAVIYPSLDKTQADSLDHRTTELLALVMTMALKYRKPGSKTTKKNKKPVAQSEPAVGLIAALTSFENLEEEPQLISSMLNDMEGISRSDLRMSSIRHYLHLTYDIFKNASLGEWLDINEIEMNFYLSILRSDGIGLTRFCGFHAHPWNDARTGHAIMPEDALQKITFPLLRGIITVLASLGILDLYVCSDTESPQNHFNIIHYVRLTPFGLFAFGRGSEPEFKSAGGFALRYELIDNPLMVTGKVDGNPYDTWLNGIARRVAGRWIVTTESFLSQVSKVSEIESLISDFKKYICADLTPAWEDFFERIRRNSGTGVATLDNIGYTVFRLDNTNKELLAYLSSCKELESIAIKAEGYRLLVCRTDIAKFRQILKRGGFTIDI